MNNITALIVGDGPLLLQCLEAYMASGGQVTAVVTQDSAIASHGDAIGVRVLNKSSVVSGELEALEFDYLLSIANLDMLPESLLKRARKMAINFHDGPLPRYAGLNATSWAILQGETAHGVTWHEMTGKADMGGIVEAAPLTIDPNDTAFSLNAKCFEAGLASFKAMIPSLLAGNVTVRPQDGARTYFGRYKRPDAAATLRFDVSADDTLALSRAMTFGPYTNTLSFLKVWTGQRVLLVSDVEAATGAASLAAHGTVIAHDADGVVVAAQGGQLLRLSGLTDSSGAAVDPAQSGDLALGARLPDLAASDVAELDRHTVAAAKAESFWMAHSARAVASEAAPYPRALKPAAGVHTFPLDAGAELSLGLAAVAVWSAHVGGASSAAIAFHDGAQWTGLGKYAAWFAPWRPLALDVAGDAQRGELVAHARALVDAARDKGPLACDAYMRRPRAERMQGRADDFSLAVAIGGDAPKHPNADIILRAGEAGLTLEISAGAYDADVAGVIAGHIASALAGLRDAPQEAVSGLDVRPAAERGALAAFEAGTATRVPFVSMHQGVTDQTARSPDRLALRTRDGAMTYAELDAASSQVAEQLMARGVRAGETVGVCMNRSMDLVVALLAVLKTGCAYVPLDPAYPADRLDFMLEDSQSHFVITDAPGAQEGVRAQRLAFGELRGGSAGGWRAPEVGPQDLAYLIYTSGSTGRPKGVKVQHGALANFFAAMDVRLPYKEGDTWLAVTSPNFDISVLELFWTLSRGLTVALHGAETQKTKPFSLFYFAASSAANADQYKLLFAGARFADENGFEAIWTPERHFHDFGGSYPNPAVTSAALAAITKNVHIRAGSCVLPLHHPIRVAEDWSVIDNVSRGRVGLAIATGWQPNDFVLAPDNFATRRDTLSERIDTLKRLWRGEAVPFVNPNGVEVPTRIHPRPIQKELPIWLTIAKAAEAFESAGRQGFNVLTHLLGMSVAELGGNIARYREAWRKAGHPGEGRVTLMLHSFAGETDDDVCETVREPMKAYLRTSVDLVRDAAWTFPTLVQKGEKTGRTAQEVMDAEPLTDEEMDALLDHAFERYFQTSGLFGSVETCAEMARRVHGIGVDEIGCLVDFGVDQDLAIEHLPYLKRVMDRAGASPSHEGRHTVAEDVEFFGASHLQCTPSMAMMLGGETEKLAGLQVLCVGGEALPMELARSLRTAAPQAKLFNMYGPTETTIWSTMCHIDEVGNFIPLGEALLNTTLRIDSPSGRPQPALAAGELLIGGDGVTLGYWNREDLTAERFVTLPDRPGEVMYRTGDLVRRHSDGKLEFLGRIDHQVKLRGHRIELGEIEAALIAEAAIAQAVVVALGDSNENKRLVAYCVVKPGAELDTKALRSQLLQSLPEIMVPAHIVVLPSLPLTPNGKIDRKALPAPEAAVQGAVETPSDEVEQKLASTWSDLLGLPAVDVNANFFDLGGHSLLAFQMLRRVQSDFSRDVTITDVFRFPTVRTLAERIRKGGSDDKDKPNAGLGRAQARLAARRRDSAGA
ncbi:ATP-dependent AMP-binding enzyme family protein [Hyphomonas neptunium ATCC 15444]|uniref:ATP-dependent AMP-binding enzyme family protein n=2 Tax=Hyphomonas TaxID=85 RepID=Q0C2Y6_HYPNA|nr:MULTISPECIES: MupA/Atu3671 family FMN-dependent luciferase-like monooxygenase [Hyphomonas]ABI77343.1 ATP-dependent AMP-binding enzyme family protein [Hyphomonas neptunium ATCC 15444]KCZ95858.1 ATP-dependent AMP-binding enzyme family protein [Hyphomonas hirschiana VP5]